MIDRIINLNLGRHAPPARVPCTEGDTGWSWHFRLWLDGQRWTIPSDAQLLLVVRKADGHLAAGRGTLTGNEAVVASTMQMTAARGPARGTLYVIDTAGAILGTAPMILDVAPGGDDLEIISGTDLTAIEEILSELAPIVSAAEVISDRVPALVSDWLAENIHITEGVDIDPSLSVSGAAADAGAVGDQIINRATIPYTADNTFDLNAATTPGIYQYQNVFSLLNRPDSIASAFGGKLIVISKPEDGNSTNIIQMILHQDRVFYRFRRKRVVGGSTYYWVNWFECATAEAMQSKFDDTVTTKVDYLAADTDLDTLTAPGIYYSNDLRTVANGLPAYITDWIADNPSLGPTYYMARIINIKRNNRYFAGAVQIIFWQDKCWWRYHSAYESAGWFEWHYVGEIATDTSMTRSGVPADAKATGARFEALTSAENIAEADHILWNGAYLDKNNRTIVSSSYAVRPPRSLLIPIKGGTKYTVSCDIASHKRIGTTSTFHSGVTFDNLVFEENAASSDVEITSGLNHAWLFIQMFVDSDAQQDINVYLKHLCVTEQTAGDAFADRKVRLFEAERNKPFFTENIAPVQILGSLADVTLPDASDNVIVNDGQYSVTNSPEFHSWVQRTLVDGTFLTAHTMTDNGEAMQDTSGETMYYYRTHPKAVTVLGARSSTLPLVPAQGGLTLKPFRILISSNIHFFESSGNFAVYNLIKDMMDSSKRKTNDVLRWFYNHVEIIWIPCAKGTGSVDDYCNVIGQNVNRCFPETVDGECLCNAAANGYSDVLGTVCLEAKFVKRVFDDFADGAYMHLDLHQFRRGTASAYNTWLFTDDPKLSRRGAVALEDVIDAYYDKYGLDEFAKDYGAFINTLYTSANYLQMAHGIPSATLENALLYTGSEAADYAEAQGYTKFHLEVALMRDLVAHVITSMCI